MNPINPAIGLPGRRIFIRMATAEKLNELGRENVAESAMKLPFETYKHLLSRRPLRRPGRVSPLEEK